MTEFRRIRERARISRDRAAVLAGVSYPTARLFESAGPEAIRDRAKRESLISTYEQFRGATPPQNPCNANAPEDQLGGAQRDRHAR